VRSGRQNGEGVAERRGRGALYAVLSFVHLIGIVGFAVAEVVQLLQDGTDGLHLATLENALVWLIGVNGIVAGSGHLLYADPVARSIGWPERTPWQWEVGLAGIGFGVLGVMSPAYDRDFWLATIIVSSIFLLGAAVGHIRQLVTAHNLSPGNAGPILFTDVLIPFAVIALYFTY
jgi:hypothetical protein